MDKSEIDALLEAMIGKIPPNSIGDLHTYGTTCIQMTIKDNNIELRSLGTLYDLQEHFSKTPTTPSSTHS